MRLLLLPVLGLALVYLACLAVRCLGVAPGVAQYRTSHFTIVYRGIYPGEAAAVGRALEAHYQRIRTELQDPPHNTIRVFIYGSQADFNQGAGLEHSSANGTSRGPDEFHVLWTTWFNSLFPDNPVQTAIHEFTHCVQLNILLHQALAAGVQTDEASFNRSFEKRFLEEYPQWFWEALSIYQAREVNRLSVHYGMRHRPTLQALNNSNQIYQVGYTLMAYIVATWGRDKIPALIRSYGDIQQVLGVGPAALEQGWYKFVEAQYGGPGLLLFAAPGGLPQKTGR